jgi:hypothetical protein
MPAHAGHRVMTRGLFPAGECFPGAGIVGGRTDGKTYII